jgi:hypothetical protein
MTILPEHVLNKMSKADRKRLGKAGLTATEIHSKQDYRAEIEIHNQIKAYLSRNNIRYLYASPNKRSTLPVGFPDITILLIGGRMLFLEVKTANGKLSPEQIDWQTYLTSIDHLHYVVRSYDEAIAIIKNYHLHKWSTLR